MIKLPEQGGQPFFSSLLECIDSRRPACLVVFLGPESRSGQRLILGPEGPVQGEMPTGSLGAWLLTQTREALARGTSATLRPDGDSHPEVEVYFEPYPPRPHLFIIGGGHVGKALHDLAAPLPIFQLTVVDDRPDYASRKRFPGTETVCCDYAETFDRVHIDPGSFIVIVTRGHRADRICLERAVETDARYIGMIGSKRKVLMTYKNLIDQGVSRERLARIHAPVGLDLSAAGAPEIAVSILAELIAVKNGLDPRRLHSLSAGLEIPP